MRALFIVLICVILAIVAAHSGHDHDHDHEPLVIGGVKHQDVHTFAHSMKRCATQVPSEAKMKEVQRKVDAHLLQKKKLSLSAVPEQVQISVHLHEIRGSGNSGALTQERIDSQMALLNQAFGPGGFQFNLVSHEITMNDAWYNVVDHLTEVQMKMALHVGGMDTLNIYTVNPTDYLGVAYLPFLTGEEQVLDGLNLYHDTLPGGMSALYNGGMTAVHEVGHWLGLYHTFTGGCSTLNGGDGVADTTPEAGPDYVCDAQRDSCRGGKRDPVHNYMDYGPDSCLNEFTAGQVDRMHAMWDLYRKPMMQG